jgi:hypothetical protein
MMPASERQLSKCIKANYGNWALVHLPSGQWGAIWRASLGVEDMCEAILNGTWFHAANPSFSSRAGALEGIVKGIEREIQNERSPSNKETFKSFLQRARNALSRQLTAEKR